MAQPVVSTLASWQAERRRSTTSGTRCRCCAASSRRRPSARACLTLVAVVHDPELAASTLEVVRELGGRHPSRLLVIVIDDNHDVPRLDARVSVDAIEHAGRVVCFEDLLLTVAGPARWHLHSLIEPFTLPDVPVAIWLPNTLPSIGDPLLEIADRIVIDTRAMGERADLFVQVDRLMRHLPVADLSWARLRFWRTMLAGLFEGAEYRPFLEHINHIEVSGNFGPRYMVGGWLMGRLGLSPRRVHVDDAQHVRIRISAQHDGRHGIFTVERAGHERVLEAIVDIEDGPTLHQTLRMPSAGRRGRWPRASRPPAPTWSTGTQSATPSPSWPDRS